MQDYTIILFDLDGTLTDSAPGILNSVRYACRKLGLPIPGEETLRRFLGPPLIASFRELMGLDAAGADRAVSAFRENGHHRHQQAGGVCPAYSGAFRSGAVLRFHLRCHAR